MTGEGLLFWGILIFVGLVFDQYNSKKKRENSKVSNYIICIYLFLLADASKKGVYCMTVRLTRRGNDDEASRKGYRCNRWRHRYWS